MQARFDVHDTPFRALRLDPGGVGTRWIAQREPFQRSTRAKVPRRLLNEPTAMHHVFEVHDTPFRALRLDPGGVGTRWIAQREPFQRSTRAKVPRRLLNEPTAVQDGFEAHDTPPSVLLFDPSGIGTGQTDQRERLAAPALGADPRTIMHPTTAHMNSGFTR